MKNQLLALVVLALTAPAQAGLRSPFPSNVEGLDLPNANIVSSDEDAGVVMRSMAPHTPDNHLDDLMELGLSRVLIFKNETKRQDVTLEIELLEAKGIPYEHIGFPWKGHTYGEACRQTLRALDLLIEAAQTEGEVFLFHCTVGEDRTGYLSALYQQLVSGKSVRKAFQEDMCQKGYAAGNPNKPFKVTKEIRKTLTPLYVEMSRLIQGGELTVENLDESVCDRDVELKPSTGRKYRCEPQDLE